MPFSTSSSNRRAAIGVACAVIGFFLVDAYLYGAQRFLKTFGEGTQEGQILSKLARAERMAKVADVIAFGSSYTRSGLSGEPFLERGLLPWNFGISGGGPITDYFALKRLVPILSQRTVKPVLLLELKTEALERRDDTLWAEYPQVLGIARGRLEKVAEAPMLLPFFREAGMTSQYVSAIVVPSGIYRSETVPLIVRRGQLDDFFYGMEDFSGYAPLYSVLAPAVFAADAARPPVHPRWSEGKVEALRRWLRIATTLGGRVILAAAPSVPPGRDHAVYDDLFAGLAREFTSLTLVRSNEYPLERTDFDAGRHPNVQGADKMGAFWAARLPPGAGALAQRIQSAFEVYPLPPLAAWNLPASRLDAPAASDGALLTDGAPSEHADVAASPAIHVTRGRELVFEARVTVERGSLLVKVLWNDSRGRARETVTVASADLESPTSRTTRVFVRVTPETDTVSLAVSDYSSLIGGPRTIARVKPLRLWANR